MGAIELCKLKEGQSAQVLSLQIRGNLRRRLYDLGLVPGTRVRCLFSAPAGSPIAYSIRGAVIALRKADAARVQVVWD